MENEENIQNDFRTYHRRTVTRNSGFHVCEDTTGGECIIKKASKLVMNQNVIKFYFSADNLELIELFESGTSILGFGGYIKSNKPIRIDFSLKYLINDEQITYTKTFDEPLDAGDWNNIGFHKEISTDIAAVIYSVDIEMQIQGEIGNIIQFVAFNFGILKKEEFVTDEFKESFYQKTAMHIPYLYYLNANTDFTSSLTNNTFEFQLGDIVVLKSCNRCGRFLPINIFNELKTLSYSLHCKKRAPCKHSTFSSYTILNINEIEEDDLKQLNISNNKVVTYYGHQLECKACKKFFVNAPLNPQRNAQQFKEDSLRRRALEILINELLNRNLIHFEFETQTKKEFSKYIWEKFDKKCFKCKQPLVIDEMHLDHTRPLAYLYRLDETATCLCSKHNSQKRDHFPVEYYTKKELQELSDITGLSLEELKKKEVNFIVLNLLLENIVWFFDIFLNNPDYQKVRDDRLTSDKILASLQRVIPSEINLVNEYRKVTGHFPKTVTVKRN